jgi:hypothetical protein
MLLDKNAEKSICTGKQYHRDYFNQIVLSLKVDQNHRNRLLKRMTGCFFI